MRPQIGHRWLIVVVTLTLTSVTSRLLAADEKVVAPATAASNGDKEDQRALHQLAPSLWIDKARTRVILVGKVCLREGQLEMFACPEGTKEHESVVSVPVTAEKVHTALLAVGAKEGKPVQFDPEYRPASGTEIDVGLYWTDDAGKRRSAWAQDWVQDARTGKALAQPWVFAGSGFWLDERTKKQHYLANQGELICVSNFSSAMLDLPIESSDKAGQLMFNAYTERIPPLDTPVTIVLTPKLAKDGEAKNKAD